MDGEGQTPMGGPSTPMLSPAEYEAIWEILYARSIGLRMKRPADLLLISAKDKIERYLGAREAWTEDAKAKKLKTSR